MLSKIDPFTDFVIPSDSHKRTHGHAFFPYAGIALLTLIAAEVRRIKRTDKSGIPHNGVMVRKTDVRRHRYLAAHGMPHSRTLASVHIGIGK